MILENAYLLLFLRALLLVAGITEIYRANQYRKLSDPFGRAVFLHVFIIGILCVYIAMFNPRRIPFFQDMTFFYTTMEKMACYLFLCGSTGAFHPKIALDITFSTEKLQKIWFGFIFIFALVILVIGQL
jgi:hypothetical protein